MVEFQNISKCFYGVIGIFSHISVFIHGCKIVVKCSKIMSNFLKDTKADAKLKVIQLSTNH